MQRTEQGIRNSWGAVKRYNAHLMSIPGMEERWGRGVFEDKINGQDTPPNKLIGAVNQ